MTRERRVRMYADHFGLTVRGSNGAFKLMERYDKKREIGTYRSVATLERGIERYGRRMLRELMVRRVRIARLLRSRRHPLDQGRIRLLRLALRRGEKLPPIDIITRDDGSLWVFDGYHRYRAYKLEGRKTILANVIVN